ncbi:phosphoribosyltransferase [Opacimonas viscosa]|uniref:Hypoxanthine phosphoribosyltransferase n=1 Tax=Opacimonas viscosa TaxID=2961944 RepID=A0AA41WW09_9ALTE|nr:phosphoribosyltransferase family protein [Opacimonas viscosa]MCP3427609.1 hypoxanthine phosphoribosyltransferase [Opacimonas viscosa]
MDKYFISAQELLEDSFRLAHQVYESGFRPEFIIGIWRGGAPIGIAVQEYFEYKETATDHIAVRTSSYYGIGQQSREIKVHGLHYLIENANATDKLLIVDDVFDSGRSVEALLKQIKQQMRNNTPKSIKVACPWYKPQNNKTSITPDYFIKETDEWIVFPHEVTGLSKEEIRSGKSDLANILDLL